RTPWTIAEVGELGEVWLAHYLDKLDIAHDDAVSPIISGDLLLTRNGQPPAGAGDMWFTPYTVSKRSTTAPAFDPPLNLIDFCAIADEVDIRFAPLRRVTVGVVSLQPLGDCRLELTPLSGDTYFGRGEFESSVTPTPRAFFLNVSSG